MTNKYAIVKNVSIELTGRMIPMQRIEFDILTDVGEFHYDSDYCTYDEIQCKLHDLFTQPTSNTVEVGINQLLRFAVQHPVRLTAFMELPIMEE